MKNIDSVTHGLNERKRTTEYIWYWIVYRYRISNEISEIYKTHLRTIIRKTHMEASIKLKITVSL